MHNPQNLFLIQICASSYGCYNVRKAVFICLPHQADICQHTVLGPVLPKQVFPETHKRVLAAAGGTSNKDRGRLAPKPQEQVPINAARCPSAPKKCHKDTRGRTAPPSAKTLARFLRSCSLLNEFGLRLERSACHSAGVRRPLGWARATGRVGAEASCVCSSFFSAASCLPPPDAEPALFPPDWKQAAEPCERAEPWVWARARGKTAGTCTTLQIGKEVWELWNVQTLDYRQTRPESTRPG